MLIDFIRSLPARDIHTIQKMVQERCPDVVGLVSWKYAMHKHKPMIVAVLCRINKDKAGISNLRTIYKHKTRLKLHISILVRDSSFPQ